MEHVKGDRKLLDWLRDQTAGDIVNYEEVMHVTNWKESTLITYIAKNKITPFLYPLENKRLKVILNGEEIEENYFYEIFTQTAPRSLTLSAGQEIEGHQAIYKLDAPLGQGAIGHVWLAQTQGVVQQKVAVKVMLPRADLLQKSLLPNIRERFCREAKNGRALDHENIIRYLDHGKVGGNPFLVMELANCSIRTPLESQGAVSEEKAAEIIKCCAYGLQYLHSKGCVHRDIKPDNILQFPNVIKLGDLGIVKWSDFDPAFTKGGTITRQSVQLGSLLYMAPEQQTSPHEAVSKSDIYALAVTWIELLTGFTRSPHAVIAGAYKLSGVNPEFVKIIRKMHSFKPDQRPGIDDILRIIK